MSILEEVDRRLAQEEESARKFGRPVKGNGSAREEQEKPPRKSQATELVELAQDADLFHDHEGVAYATITVNGHREHWPIHVKGFRDWLARRYWQAKNKVPSSQALTDALKVLEGAAVFDGPERPVFLRVADHDGKIYIDLCRPNWQCVEIDAAGWRVLDKAPVRFIRRNGMLPLPEPQPGQLVDLWRFLNLSLDDARLLTSAWLVQALRPSGPYPVLIVQGEQGTAKSTFMMLLRSLIDPSVAGLRCMPRDERDLLIAARNSHVIALDNLSGISPWLSDALCRISTGGGFSTRQLYTDTEETLIRVSKPIMLNGIDDIASRQDLIDRSLILNLDPIPKRLRLAESALMAAFHEAVPGIFGALLEGVVVGLKRLPAVRLEELPRMADFTLWATAAEPALGATYNGHFLEAYTENRETAVEAGLEGSPVAAAIEVLGAARGRQPWESQSTELLKELPRHYDRGADVPLPKSWPRSGTALRSQLTRLAPALRTKGVEVSFRRSHGRRLIKIEWVCNETAPAAPNGQESSNDAGCKGATSGATSKSQTAPGAVSGAAGAVSGAASKSQTAPSEASNHAGFSAVGAGSATSMRTQSGCDEDAPPADDREVFKL